MGVQFTGKKRYVTLEWPLTHSEITEVLLQHVMAVPRFSGKADHDWLSPHSWGTMSASGYIDLA